MSKLVIIFLFFGCIGIGFSQSNPFPFASKQAREKLLIKLNDSIINPSANDFLANKRINWESYAWATAYIIDESKQNFAVLEKALKEYNQLSKSDLQKVFGSVFACFPNQFVPEIRIIANGESENEKIFATAVNYLAQNKVEVKQLLESKFKNSNHPIIQALRNQFQPNYNPISIADLESIIRFNKDKKSKFLYSIQHQDRNKVGKVFIQTESGLLVKENGKVIFIDQLARSATNLPMYITNGNTPVGLYKINSLHKSENVFIGPSLAFVTFLPFECDAATFFNSPTTKFTLENYLSFFPATLQKNTLLQQTFWAGKAGRTEIHFHGTTIDPNLYIGKEFYPQTPSMGCLCVNETWDKQGNLIESGQQKLVNTWLKTPNEKGYAYVLELQESDWKTFEEKMNTL
ncbi:hypothetical protein [Flavobacterium nackdongense]|uniref:Uncharacterized protein n=1 Tax=Flavobacterium nackdongense TaxID=2547394 RepID=A0A4P6Y9P8_9FLAO|nr:hypothetical protein [Flavobacterium nackdongense]QBN17404.1 hypothetical protein E1750_00850 [Flavobacterium nackdongense]